MIIESVGVCTLPIERRLPSLLVKALVALIPMSQSASDLHFADSPRLSSSFDGLSLSKPSAMADLVMDWSHNEITQHKEGQVAITKARVGHRVTTHTKGNHLSCR